MSEQLENIVATVLCLWFGGIILVAAWRHFRARGKRGGLQTDHKPIAKASPLNGHGHRIRVSVASPKKVRTSVAHRPNYYGMKDEIMRRILEARLDE